MLNSLVRLPGPVNGSDVIRRQRRNCTTCPLVLSLSHERVQQAFSDADCNPEFRIHLSAQKARRVTGGLQAYNEFVLCYLTS
jgi:hypothetical protein